MLKDFKKPDLNAPRFRPKQYDPLTKDFYKRLRKQFPKYKKWSDSKIKQLIKGSNETFHRTIIEHRDGIQLPENLGYLFLATCLPKIKENTDYKVSAELSKKVQQRNWESDRYIAKIFFTTYEIKYHFKNHDMYGFSGCRELQRLVPLEYPTRWKSYIQVDHTTKLSRLFRTTKHKDKQILLEADLLKTYDEFDMN